MTDRPDPESPPQSRRRRPPGTLRISAALVAAALVAGAAWLFFRGLQKVSDLTDVTFSATHVREVAWATLQREGAERFLVTGRLDLTATTEVEDTRTVFPGLLDLSLGTSRATVRVPGRIFYGVDLAAVQPGDIAVAADSTLVIRLPGIAINSVEPLLGSMEVRTERGWARLPGRSERDAEHRALALLRPVLMRQGEAHLADAEQPRRNTARAVGALLLPVLEAMEVASPKVEVRIAGRTLIVRPSSGNGGGTGETVEGG